MTQVKQAPTPQAIFSSRDNQALKLFSMARSPMARSMGVGPHTKSSGLRSFCSRSQGSKASVTSPLMPREPSLVVGRTSQPRASNSSTHKMSSAVRPPKKATPLRLSDRALR